MRKAVLSVVAVLAVVAAGLVAWQVFGPGLFGGGEQVGGQGGRPPPEVRVVPARTGTIAVTAESVGTLEASEQVELTSTVAGRITDILFREGEPVEAGELLVRLDSEEEEAALLEARARLREARRQLERAEELAGEGYTPVAELDERRARAQTAAASVATAEAQLADRTIKAPFAGRAGLRQVSVGALITPGTPITTLVSVNPIELQFDVPGTLLWRVESGLPVLATQPGVPDRTIEGEVTAVDSSIHPDTRTITLQAQIPNGDGALLPGQFVNVELVLERRESVVVPEEAIVLEGTDTYVYVVGDDDVVSRTAVKTGERRPGEVEIRSGVEPGKRVVVAGLQGISDGQKVRPRPADGQRRSDGQPMMSGAGRAPVGG